MARNQYDYPDAPIVGDDRKITTAWDILFTRWKSAIFSVVQSGPTADRPAKLLWVGRRYFDTTLGLPVWYDGAGWVDATGTAA